MPRANPPNPPERRLALVLTPALESLLDALAVSYEVPLSRPVLVRLALTELARARGVAPRPSGGKAGAGSGAKPRTRAA